MTTYSDFRNRLLHALGAEANTTYSDDLVYEATLNASNAILPWCPNLQVATASVLATQKTATLPSNLWRTEAIIDETTGLILPKFEIRSGVVRKLATDQSFKNFVDWMEFPKGTVTMSNITDKDRTLTILYIAYWSKPANKTDLAFGLPMPESALTGMLYYAAAHCLIPSSVNSAQIRQFNTKVDSGSPIDNSLEVEAKFLRQLFLEEMKTLPRYIGATQ